MFTFMMSLLVLANAIGLDEYLELHNVTKAGYAIRSENGTSYHIYPEVFNITLELNEPSYLSAHGERIETGDQNWETALVSRGLIQVGPEEASAALSLDDIEVHYNMKVINFFSEQFITDDRAYDHWVMTTQLFISLHDVIYNYVHNSHAQNVHDDVIPVGGVGYLRMVNGDSQSNFDDLCLAKLKTHFGQHTGVPSAATCLRLTSQSDERGWTIAYGADWHGVMGLPCDKFQADEKITEISC